jgi:hypothetical protein
MKAIPKNLLNDSLEVYSGYGESRTSVTLHNVKLERREIARNRDGVIMSKNSVLCFFDCHFSTPAGFDFAPRGDKYILSDGKELRLIETEPSFDGVLVHHVEMTGGEEYEINAACY